MKSLFSCIVLALLCAAPLAHAAEDDGPVLRMPPEPEVKETVIEDDRVRIEELRVRGQTKRIVVQPKKADGSKGAPAYEVVPADPTRDTSTASRNGMAGQRLWHVFSF